MGIGIALVVGGFFLAFYAMPPVSGPALAVLGLAVVMTIGGIRWIAASRRPS